MKNLLLSFVLVLLSFAGYSTSSGIEIHNNTECDIYLQIRGSSECPSCEVEFTSCMLVIPAGTHITYANAADICGFPPRAFVHSALLYSGPRDCQRFGVWVVGDPRCYQPEVDFWSSHHGCEPVCDCLHARWEPAECDGIARLIIERC